jgi:hypothetical protein
MTYSPEVGNKPMVNILEEEEEEEGEEEEGGGGGEEEDIQNKF